MENSSEVRHMHVVTAALVLGWSIQYDGGQLEKV